MRITDYDRTFDVVVNSLADTPDTILSAVDPSTFLTIPQIGDLWLPSPTVPRIAKCKDRKTRRNGQNPFQWEVSLQYGTDWQLSDPDPTKRPARVRGEPVTYREAAAQGYRINEITNVVDDGTTPILNSSRDPFDPPPEKDATRRRVTITRYELNNPDPITEPYQDTVNAVTWRGYGVGCAKYCGCSYEGPEWFNGRYYYLVTHTVDCRRQPGSVLFTDEGWAYVVVDAGYRELVPELSGNPPPLHTGNFVRQEIRDQPGISSSGPHLLNGAGQKLILPPPGAPIFPIYLGWRIYDLTDFTNDLALPENP